ALALGEPAARVEQFYRERGAKIFTRRPPSRVGWTEWLKVKCINKVLAKYGFDYDHLKQSKYTAVELRNALTEVFGDTKLEDSKTRLIIPAVNLTGGQTIVF